MVNINPAITTATAVVVAAAVTVKRITLIQVTITYTNATATTITAATAMLMMLTAVLSTINIRTIISATTTIAMDAKKTQRLRKSRIRDRHRPPHSVISYPPPPLASSKCCMDLTSIWRTRVSLTSTLPPTTMKTMTTHILGHEGDIGMQMKVEETALIYATTTTLLMIVPPTTANKVTAYIDITINLLPQETLCPQAVRVRSSIRISNNIVTVAQVVAECVPARPCPAW